MNKKVMPEDKITIEDLKRAFAENRKNFKERMEKEKARERLTYEKAMQTVFVSGEKTK